MELGQSLQFPYCMKISSSYSSILLNDDGLIASSQLFFFMVWTDCRKTNQVWQSSCFITMEAKITHLECVENLRSTIKKRSRNKST